MSGIPGAGADAALRRLRQNFAVALTVTGPGFSVPTELMAVRSNGPADAFDGAGRSKRRTTFEFAMDDFPVEPNKETHRFVDQRDREWRPVDIVRRDDVDAWSIDVAMIL